MEKDCTNTPSWGVWPTTGFFAFCTGEENDAENDK